MIAMFNKTRKVLPKACPTFVRLNAESDAFSMTHEDFKVLEKFFIVL